MDPSKPRLYSNALRNLFATWLSNILLSDDRSECAPVLQHLLRLSKESDGPSSLKAYLHGLRAPASAGGQWADAAVAYIACKALGINMSIYSYNPDTGHLRHEDHSHWPETALRASLFFSGSTDSGHYEPLRPTMDSNTAPLHLLMDTHLHQQEAQLSLEESIPLWSSKDGLYNIRQAVWDMMQSDTPYSGVDTTYEGTSQLMKFISAELDSSPPRKKNKR